MFCWDFEVGAWSRFWRCLIKIFVRTCDLMWPKKVTLVSRTQPSGPLCLWQCFIPLLGQNLIVSVKIAYWNLSYFAWFWPKCSIEKWMNVFPLNDIHHRCVTMETLRTNNAWQRGPAPHLRRLWLQWPRILVRLSISEFPVRTIYIHI